MNNRTKFYVYAVSAIGILLTIECAASFFGEFAQTLTIANLPLLVIPVAVCAICRSLPLYIRQNETLDVSVISVLAVYLTQGMRAAVTVFILASLFAFEPDPKTGKYRHSFRIGIQKVLFNNATIVLSVVLPALALRPLTWTPGDLTLPTALVPTALFSVLTFLTNGILQLIRPCLNHQLTLRAARRILLGLTPNVIAAMPMGYLMAIGYSSVTNVWFVVLMMLPLMLARYAWKLYLDTQRTQSHLMTAFIHSLEAKDKYTQGHSTRVAAYSIEIARRLNLSHHEIALLEQGAILHDIGKIGISDAILNKPAKLTDEEFSIIQRHPLIGENILSDVGLYAPVLEMVRNHHERYDGKGYPDAIPNSQLSIMTRILSVADAYDAMTSDRPYRKGLPPEQALEILREGAGTQFDPSIVYAITKDARPLKVVSEAHPN